MIDFNSRKVCHRGSVRVDLVGGTLDLNPLNIILNNVNTYNIATSLMAEAVIESINSNQIIFYSKDYNKTIKITIDRFQNDWQALKDQNIFEEFYFVAEILKYICCKYDVNFKTGLKVSLSSGSPAGAGLGGSSAMGVTFFTALLMFIDKQMERTSIINIVQNIEAKILNAGPAGYQDYYPALFGGILCLKSTLDGVEPIQMYSSQVKNYLENHLLLVHSGQSRNSGINNWEVYKSFFDRDQKVIGGLQKINSIAQEFDDVFKLIHKNNKNNKSSIELNTLFRKLILLIAREGEVRNNLFSGIITSEIENLYIELKALKLVDGIKACGAGGGGCFILMTQDKSKLLEYSFPSHMKILPFEIMPPLT